MGTRRSCLLLLLLALLAAAPALAAKSRAYVDGVQLRRGTRADLVLDFRVQDALNERLLDTLDSGLPVRFTYWVRVTRSRDLGRDDVVVDLRIVRVLEKDNLKNRFRVSMEAGGETWDVGSLTEAMVAMSRVEGLSLFPLEALEGRRPLVLRVKAQLQRFQLPFRLHYVFAFVSVLDVETDWYVVELPLRPDAIP